MAYIVVLLFVIACIANFTHAKEYTPAALVDEIHGLPTVDGPLASRHFVGFLDASPPGAEEGDELTYWFVESEGDSVKDPLILWLNGGPGASSLLGFFTEFGPYIVAADGGVHHNPYTFARFANVLFLESPTGVGWSRCAGDFDKVCHRDDDMTAAGNLQALRSFLHRYPQMQQKPLMIWGESYAGVYVPTLSMAVAYADPPVPVNFLGFAAGNPCTADKFQSVAGVMPVGFDPDYALNRGHITSNMHDLLSTCGDYSHRSAEGECRAAWRKFDIDTGDLGSGPPSAMPGLGHGKGFMDMYDSASYTGSLQPYWDAIKDYLNRDDVLKALKLDKVPRKWSLFAEKLEYSNQYLACSQKHEDYAHQYNKSVLPFYLNLTLAGYSVLQYNGDEDASVQWRKSEEAIRSINFPIAPRRGWRPWFQQQVATPLEILAVKSPEWGPRLSASTRRGNDPELGGYIEEFKPTAPGAGTLSFVTVRDVGHLVPQHRPQTALHLFERTMRAAIAQRGAPPLLSPPLPASLTASTNDAFYGDGKSPGVMGSWLKEASSPKWIETPQPKVPGVPGAFADYGLKDLIFGLVCAAVVIAIGTVVLVRCRRAREADGRDSMHVSLQQSQVA